MADGGRGQNAKFVRTITVTNAVFHLFGTNPTDFVVGTDNNIGPSKLRFSCETNGVRYTTNGVVPSATLGIAVPANGIEEILGETNIKNLRMFRAGAADATVNYQTYF